MLFALAYSSFFNHIWWDDYTPLGYIWGFCGITLVAVTATGASRMEAGEKSPATSLIMFGWACSDALLGVLFLAGSHFPYGVWLGLGLALITILLMHLGAIFLVWDSLTGIFGAYAKALTVAMGSAAIVAAGIIAAIWATTAAFS